MKKLILLDSNSLINRAFYALPNLTNHKGQFTGAIYGYLNMLLKIIEDYKPTHIVATFDRKAPTFRKLIYDQYKAQRKGMPDELASQLQPTKDILTAMKIPVVELDGYEADDIIGTLSKRFDCHTYIVTGDKDSLQLIDDSTTVLLTKKGISEIVYYNEQRLAEDGLRPSQIIDLKALMGDSSDNIPGVAGVGEKTAMDLLSKYDNLDGVYNNIDLIKGKLNEKLTSDKDKAYLSYKLATIDTQVPIDFELEKAKLTMPFDSKLKELLKALEFSKIIAKMKFSDSSENESIENLVNSQSNLIDNDITIGEDFAENKNFSTAFSTYNAQPIEEKTIFNIEELQDVINIAQKKGKIAINIDKIITLATSPTQGWRVEISENLLSEGINYNDFLDKLKNILQDKSVKKLVFDAKTYLHLLSEYNIEMINYDDILLKAYLVDSNRNYKNLEELQATYNMSEGNSSASIMQIEIVVDEELQQKNLVELYEQLELPLVRTLYNMEKQGFSIDTQILDKLNTKFGGEIDQLTNQIVEMAGGKSFNINSPKQLAVVLFEDLGLKCGKKTKTGFSTNVDVLNSLKNEHPIIESILRYRELTKLKGTYLDGIKPLIDSHNKIRTIFKQTVTATGRLSSTEPNLQNIPIRKPEGKQIRQMFVAQKGNKLVCADYSQIELRLMAIFSKDPTMLQAFKDNIDIHAVTASQVMGVGLHEVTKEMRGQAKAVNFGIIYGISDFGLSEDLGIPVWQAKEFIARYFITYPMVKKYMDNLIDEAKQCGYAKTFMGRRRDIPELRSSNYNLRSFGERVAMNMPLQGSASDIIKLAMLAVEKNLADASLKAKLIMQVHDELIVDCPVDEVDQVMTILQESMQNVANFEIVLTAESSVGDNWLEAK